MINVREGGRLPRPPPGSGHAPFNGLERACSFVTLSLQNITGNIGHGSLTRFKHECRYSAAKKEFEDGVLPRPSGSARDEKNAALDVLIVPKEMRTAEWIPVVKDSGFPLAWSDSAPRFAHEDMSDTSAPARATLRSDESIFGSPDFEHNTWSSKRSRWEPPPDLWKARWLPVGEDEFPLAWHDTPKRSTPPDNEEVETLEAEPANEVSLEEETSPPDPEPPTPEPTPVLDNTDHDYDPTLRFDEFGRLKPPPQPPTPPKITPEEPEEDQVGFGLR